MLEHSSTFITRAEYDHSMDTLHTRSERWNVEAELEAMRNGGDRSALTAWTSVRELPDAPDGSPPGQAVGASTPSPPFVDRHQRVTPVRTKRSVAPTYNQEDEGSSTSSLAAGRARWIDSHCADPALHASDIA